MFPATLINLTAGTWKSVSLDMSALNPNGSVFNTVWLSNYSGNTVTWYVDKLYIVGNDQDPPPVDSDNDGVIDPNDP